MIGRFKDMNVHPLGRQVPLKPGRGTTLPDLAAAVGAAPCLVGDGFTRADLTVAPSTASIAGGVEPTA